MLDKLLFPTGISLLTVLLAASVLTACGDKGEKAASGDADTTRTPVSLTAAAGEPATVAPTVIDLEPVWVRLGDSYGKEDVENVTESVESAEFSPDGKYIVSGAKKGWEIMVWETATGNKVWENKLSEETEAVAFSRDGRYVAAGGEYKAVYIFDAKTGKEIEKLSVGASLDGMRFSNSGNLLVAGDEMGRIHVWRTSDWEELHTLIQGEDEAANDGARGARGRHADVNSIDFTRDDQYMASAGRNQVVKIWKVADGSLVRTLEGHQGTVKTTRISPDGKLVAAGAGNGGGVRVWDFDTGKELAHLPAAGMITEAVEFTPDGRFLVVGGNEGEGRVGTKVENPGFENGDGKAFIRIYQVPENGRGEYKLVLKKPVFRQEYFHFTSDGNQMVSSHEDGTLRLWRVLYPPQP